MDPEQLQAEMGGASRAEDDDGWLTAAADELQRQMDAREAELEAHTAKKVCCIPILTYRYFSPADPCGNELMMVHQRGLICLDICAPGTLCVSE